MLMKAFLQTIIFSCLSFKTLYFTETFRFLCFPFSVFCTRLLWAEVMSIYDKRKESCFSLFVVLYIRSFIEMISSRDMVAALQDVALVCVHDTQGTTDAPLCLNFLALPRLVSSCWRFCFLPLSTGATASSNSSNVFILYVVTALLPFSKFSEIKNKMAGLFAHVMFLRLLIG